LGGNPNLTVEGMVKVSMKKIFALFSTVLFFTACQDDSKPRAGYVFECSATVESHWQLLEIHFMVTK